MQIFKMPKRRTLASTAARGSSFFSLSALLAACGGGGSGGSQTLPPAPPPPPPPQSSQAVVLASGPVSGAETFLDTDGDFRIDTGTTGGNTASDGSVTLTGAPASIRALAGTDTDLGVFLGSITLSAPAGSSIITPLTTLIDRGGISETALKAAFGIPDTANLLELNPAADLTTIDARTAQIAAEGTLVILDTLAKLIDASADQGANPIPPDEAFDRAIEIFATFIETNGTNFNSSAVVEALFASANLTLPDYQTQLVNGFVSFNVARFIDAIERGGAEESDGALVYAFTRFSQDVRDLLATTSIEARDDLLDRDTFNIIPTFQRFSSFDVFAEGTPAPGATVFTQPDYFDIFAGEDVIISGSDLLGNDISQTNALGLDIVNVELIESLIPEPSFTFNTISDQLTINAVSQGRAAFRYEIDLPNETNPIGVIYVRINPARDPFVVADDAFTVPNNQTTTLDVQGNDVGGLALLRINGTNLPSGGFFFDLPSGARVREELGTLIYDPQDAFDDLASGQIRTDTFTYLVADGNRQEDTATVTITVEGIRAAFPVAGNTLSLIEDVSPTLSIGTITASDGAQTDAVVISTINGSPFSTGDILAGTFGNIIIEEDGRYRYQLDPVKIDTNAVANGAVVTDVFTFTATDPLGNIIEDSVRIDIEGTTDLAQFIIGPSTGARNLSVSQTVTDIDIGPDDIAYIATQEGDLLRLDTQTGDFLTPITLGTDLSSVSVDPSGMFVYITENELISFNEDPDNSFNDSGVAALYQIRISDLTVDRFEFDVTGDTRGTFDVAALDNGTVVVSFDSLGLPNTTVPVILNVGTGETEAFPINENVPGAAILVGAQNGQYVVNYGGFGDINLYDAQENSIIATTETLALRAADPAFGQLRGRGISDISQEKELIVIEADGGLIVLDFEFNFISNLTPLFTFPTSPGFANRDVGGAVFSPSGDQLFVLDGTADAIRVFDTDTLQQSYWLNLGFDFETTDFTRDAVNLDFTDGGETLLVTTDTQISLFDFADTGDGTLVPLLRVESGETTVSPIDGFAIDVEGTAFFAIAETGDGALFELNGATETLDFIAPPDAAMPMDTNQDNLYLIDLTLQGPTGALQTQPVVIEVVAPDDMLSSMAASAV